MNETLIIVITALLSGLVATLVTLYWQHKNEVRNRKMAIFNTLMANRYLFTSEESVKALNSIDVVFYHDKNVRDAFKSFLDEADKSPSQKPNIADKHLKLLEEMSKALNLSGISWDTIKRMYYPVALDEKINDEITIRKQQVLKGRNIDESSKKVNDSSAINNAMAIHLITELFKNPESLRAILASNPNNINK